MSPGSAAPPTALTLDELRARIRVADIPIPEERLEVVRAILSDSLAPMRALDSRAVRALEPAVTFDAGAARAEAPDGR